MIRLTKSLGVEKAAMICIMALVAAIAVAFPAQADPPKEKSEKIGYTLGFDLGQNMKTLTIDINADMVAQGVKDGIAGKPSQLTEEDMKAVIADLNKEIQAKRAEQAKIQGEKNKKEGETYLTDNKGKPGVVTLPSGLQYKVIKEGAGKSPKVGDTAVVNYRGTLVNGEEFDSSYKRNQSAEFVVGNMIPGWNEVLQLMKEGSKWQVVIPSKLAYGERAPAQIGPNAVLLFDIELLTVKEKSAKDAAPAKTTKPAKKK